MSQKEPKITYQKKKGQARVVAGCSEGQGERKASGRLLQDWIRGQWLSDICACKSCKSGIFSHHITNLSM